MNTKSNHDVKEMMILSICLITLIVICGSMALSALDVAVADSIIERPVENNLSIPVATPTSYLPEVERIAEQNGVFVDFAFPCYDVSFYEVVDEGYYYCDYNQELAFNAGHYVCPEFRENRSFHPLSCFYRQLNTNIKSTIDNRFYEVK